MRRHRSGYISAGVSTIIFVVFVYGLIRGWEALQDLFGTSTPYETPTNYTVPTHQWNNPSWFKIDDKGK